MIDPITVGSYILSGIAPLVVLKVYNSKERIARYFKILFSSNTPKLIEIDDKKYPDIGITSTVYTLNETDDEYKVRLATIHADALAEYDRYHKDRTFDPVYDRMITMNILGAQNGTVNFTFTSHHLTFDNELGVWIENRWYSFGTCDRLSEKLSTKGLNRGSSWKLSEYTFLRLVDFYREHCENIKWKNSHDNYTLNMIRSGKCS